MRWKNKNEMGWMDGSEDEIRMLGVGGWRQSVLDKWEWKHVLKAAKAKTGL
jgi:hypothetical protein